MKQLFRDVLVGVVGGLVAILLVIVVAPDEPPSRTTVTVTQPDSGTIRALCAALDEAGSDSTDQVVLDACRAAGP